MSVKKSSKKKTWPGPSTPGASSTRTLMPSEIESLRQERKQFDRDAFQYFLKRYGKKS